MKRKQPIMVLIGGIMGSGKSTIGQRLSQALHRRHSPVHFVDIDEVSKDGAPSLEPQATPEPMRNAQLWKAYMEVFEHHLMIGESGVFVGTLREREKRQELTRLAQHAGYSVFGIFFDYQPSHVIDRALKRAENDEGHLLKINDVESLILDWRKQFDAQFHPDLENGAWMVIRDSSISPDEVLEAIIKHLDHLPKDIQVEGRKFFSSASGGPERLL
jgi:predicted kinase